jgi:hypothetical protein
MSMTIYLKSICYHSKSTCPLIYLCSKSRCGVSKSTCCNDRLMYCGATLTCYNDMSTCRGDTSICGGNNTTSIVNQNIEQCQILLNICSCVICDGMSTYPLTACTTSPRSTRSIMFQSLRNGTYAFCRNNRPM